MALDGSKVLKLSNARFYINRTIGAEAPATLDDEALKGAGYENVGHTSISDVFTQNTDGGETNILGSLQDPNLRQSVSPAIRSFVANLLQWDNISLPLYYGKNAAINGNKVSIPATPLPSEVALLFVLEDGENEVAIHAKKASAIGDGDISISDTDSLSQLPIKFTPMSYQESKFPFDIILPTAPVLNTEA